MAGEVRAAAEALETALRTVSGVRVLRDPGANIDPPVAILGAPALTWEGFALQPTEARFIVHAICPANERALERFWDLGPDLAAALDKVIDAAVRRADPGAYNASGVELPAYAITVDVSL